MAQSKTYLEWTKGNRATIPSQHCAAMCQRIFYVWRFSSNTHTHTNTPHVTIFGWIPALSAPSPSILHQTSPFFHLSPRQMHAFCIVFYVSTFFNVRQAHFPSHAQAKARACVCVCVSAMPRFGSFHIPTWPLKSRYAA